MQFNLCTCVLLWEGGTCQPTRSWSSCLITCKARHFNWVRGTGTGSWTSKQRILRLFCIRSSRAHWWITFKEENMLFWAPELWWAPFTVMVPWGWTQMTSLMFGTVRWIGTNIHGQPILPPQHVKYSSLISGPVLQTLTLWVPPRASFLETPLECYNKCRTSTLTTSNFGWNTKVINRTWRTVWCYDVWFCYRDPLMSASLATWLTELTS